MAFLVILTCILSSAAVICGVLRVKTNIFLKTARAKFPPSDIFDKVVFDEGMFHQSDHLTKTFDKLDRNVFNKVE